MAGDAETFDIKILAVIHEDLAAHRISHKLVALLIQADVERLHHLAQPLGAFHGLEFFVLEVKHHHRGLGIADIELAILDGHSVRLDKMVALSRRAGQEGVKGPGSGGNIIRGGEAAQILQAWRCRRVRKKYGLFLGLGFGCCRAAAEQGGTGQKREAKSIAEEILNVVHQLHLLSWFVNGNSKKTEVWT